MLYGIYSKSKGWYGGYMLGKVWWVADKKSASDFMSQKGALDTIEVMRQIASMPNDCEVVPL